MCALETRRLIPMRSQFHIVSMDLFFIKKRHFCTVPKHTPISFDSHIARGCG
jgi:hypothetical protein